MTPQPPSFQCHFPGCGLGYRRKEHLTRHAKSHFQSQSYECPFCDRVFARNDTLRQHVRTLHRNKELQSSRAVQACNYCRSRRSRCNGQTPCDTCFQRGIQCSYTQNSRRELKQTKNADGHMSSVASVEPGYPYSPAAEPSSVQRAETIEKCPSRIVPYVPYVEAYFKNFHPKWPFLHPATFDPDHEPAFLLQSVIMMGLWATGESNARQTAKDLHHKLTSSIYEQRVSYIFLPLPFLCFSHIDIECDRKNGIYQITITSHNCSKMKRPRPSPVPGQWQHIKEYCCISFFLFFSTMTI